jgi:polyhydroxybutyrate depolymerase
MMRRACSWTLATGAIAALLVSSDASALRPSPGCRISEPKKGRKIERRIDVGGVEREYILDVPNSVGAGEPVPLMFDFHGFGHSGDGVWGVSGFKRLAEAERFITVYPTGLPITIELRGQTRTGAGWQLKPGGDNVDLAFTKAMLAEIEKHYCVDLDRVYSTGFSNGAFFSSLLGCEMSDRFAAVAPVSGGVLRSECKPERAVAVMIHHGTRDDLVGVDRGRASRDQWLKADGCSTSFDALEGAPACERHPTCRNGAVVVYCEEDFAHRWPPQATERIWTFLKSQRRDRGTEVKSRLNTNETADERR